MRNNVASIPFLALKIMNILAAKNLAILTISLLHTRRDTVSVSKYASDSAQIVTHAYIQHGLHLTLLYLLASYDNLLGS